MEPNSVDHHDRLLVEHTRPANWSQPSGHQAYDLVVVGAGPAGLVAASIAAGLGAHTALIERKRLGGDCLHTGCVPSKALLASARKRFHQSTPGPETANQYFSQAMAHMRQVRAQLSHHDAADRFRAMGIDIFFGEACFTGNRTIHVADSTLDFKRCILATGSRSQQPDITGLESVPYLTHETLFQLKELPTRLAVIGAGPVGVEMAQAFRRFGSEVILLEQSDQLLPREDRDAAACLLEQFQSESIQVHLETRVSDIRQLDGTYHLQFTSPLETAEVIADQLLIATGRQPNLEGLDLATAGVQCHARGIQVDARLRTSNRRILAAGDIVGDQPFTHAADAMARLCVRNAFFLGRQRWTGATVPHAIYTDPEIAQIGLTAHGADQQGIAIDTYRESLEDVDRYALEGDQQGFVTVHCEKGRGQILGATIVGEQAGEMINTISLLMARRISIGALSSTMACYPTRSQVLNRVGDQFQRSRLTPRVAHFLERIIRWRR